MNGRSERKHGDFTGLAEDYSNYRPDYSQAVLRGILGIAGRPASSTSWTSVPVRGSGPGCSPLLASGPSWPCKPGRGVHDRRA